MVNKILEWESSLIYSHDYGDDGGYVHNFDIYLMDSYHNSVDNVIRLIIVNLFILLWIIIIFKYFDNKVKINVMDYYYWIIKILRGIRIEVVVKRVFVDPQGEMTNDKNYWVRTQVMQEEYSPKSGQDSLWSPKEQEAHKWPSSRQNTIK